MAGSKNCFYFLYVEKQKQYLNPFLGQEWPCPEGHMFYLFLSILLKEPFALKNSETVYFTSIFSTPSYSDIAPIDNFDLTFFYFYFVFEVFDTIQF